MIHRSPFPDVEIPEVPLSAFVLRHADRLAGKAAMIDGVTGRTVTFGELAAAVKAFAGGLAARGIGRGSTVAIMAPNSPDYAVAFHGTAWTGAVVTTMNPTYTEREVHHQLVDAGAQLVVTVAPLVELVRAASAGTAVTEIVVIGDAPDGTTPFAAMMGEPMAEHAPVEPGDVVVLPYSSGTTGLSKGVMLTHRNTVANVIQTATLSEFGEDDVIDAVLPFFHIYGMQVMMNSSLAFGATVVTLPRFDLPQFLSMHQRYRITRSFVAPPVVVALAKHPMVDDYDLSALKVMLSGAAPLSAETAAEASRRLGVEIVQGYGMTEMSPVSHFTPPGRGRPGSVGLAAPNTESRIVDPVTGESLGHGVDGELWVRGPQVMKGYHRNPEATAATLDADGWLHTGDLAHFDADGYLYIADRLKELIKYKGFQVPPAELESLLLSHPAVADSAVVGVPDDEAGELPVGFVVLKPGHEATAAEIQAFVNDQVAHYKQLRRVTLIDAVPKSASGKILRRLLRSEAVSGD